MTHRRQGLDSHIHHRGHVKIEGTKENDISVIINLKTTVKVLVKGFDVSIHGNEVVITVIHYPICVNVRLSRNILDIVNVLILT